MDTRQELLVSISDAAASMKKIEDQLRGTTHDLRTGVVKCTDVDIGNFEHLF
jgi:hypothetical protein